MEDPIRVPVLDDTTDALTDFAMPLGKLRAIIDRLIDKYGDELIIACDAGHNNVQFELYNEITRNEIAKIIQLRRQEKAIAALDSAKLLKKPRRKWKTDN